jgi:signal transduction histidine kinase
MSARIPLSEFKDTERMPIEVVRKQSTFFSASSMAVGLANAAVNAVVILNRQRQIVFASQGALDLMTTKQPDAVLGQRLGEALGCINAQTGDGDCGLSESCEHCGGLKAILTSLAGQANRQECQMTRIMNINAEALDLLVFATPFSHNDEQFTILSISDHSHEKRRQALERIFFHDLINLAGGLEAYLNDIRAAAPASVQTDLTLANEGLHQLVEEIMAQKALVAAENNELQVNLSQVDSEELLAVVQRLYQHHPTGQNRKIDIKPGSAKVLFTSDLVLLKRVLGNLIKNALEAVQSGQTVTLVCQSLPGKVQFMVENPTFMPREVRLQVFKRSFSTKGAGRGLGTYSVKLITERYLKGTVAFLSTLEAGTSFIITLPVSIPSPRQ